MRNRTISALILLAATALGLGQFGQKIPGVKLPGLDSDPFKKEPITTSLKDAKWEARDRDAFTPAEPVQLLTKLQRTESGAFLLQPGYYTLTLQSY